MTTTGRYWPATSFDTVPVHVYLIRYCPAHGNTPHRRDGQECILCARLLKQDAPPRSVVSEVEPWFIPDVPDSEVPF